MSEGRRLTGREAVNRVLWDARLNQAAFTVGYSDRVARDVREAPLTAWTGDIPAHRIVHLRCGDEIVWSRNEYEDRLSDERLPSAAWATRPPEAGLRPLPVFAFRGDDWVPVEPPASPVECARLTVATWNVLAETHDAENTRPLERRPLILGELERLRPDVLALQEMTPGLWADLLGEGWARDYFVSEPPGDEMRAGGVVLLSRLPFALVERDFHPRPALLGRWDLAGGPLHLAAVHLPSDRSRAAEERLPQLGWLLDYLARQTGEALAVGDFNVAGEEADALIGAAGFVDACPGITFDPECNPLARITSLTGRAARFDRILWRQAGRRLASSSLFGIDPAASDHFGLAAAFESEVAVAGVKPVYTSALVVIPPEDEWAPIQAIRRIHDQRFARWMPHINLVYGFVPEEHFAEAARAVEKALSSFPPFDVTLEGLGTFGHRRSFTGWLRPASDPPDALRRLQSILEGLFPLCDEQGRKSAAGFTPHLSVGQFASEEDARAAVPAWTPLRFRVGDVCLISRRGDGPFEVRVRVPLGAGSALAALVNRLAPPLTPEEERARREAIEFVELAAGEVLGRAADVRAAGSWRLGVAEAGSDVDLVWALPEGGQGLERLALALGELGPARLIADARVPVLRARISGVEVDVMAGEEGLQSCREADFLLADAARSVGVERYRELLRAVRAWAKARRLTGTGHGLPGGHAWAILTAAACRTAPGGEGCLLPHAFHFLDGHDWTRPITLTDEAAAYRMEKRDRIAVINPLAPCFNCTRTATISTAARLRQEWGRAARLAGNSDWAELFRPADLLDQSGVFLEIAAGVDELEGKLAGLMVELERALGAEVRPWPGRAVLGLRLNAGAEAAREVAEEWLGWLVPGVGCVVRTREEMAGDEPPRADGPG